MKIRLPDKVRCGATTYTVKLVDDLIIESGNTGEHRPHTGEIVIDRRTAQRTPTFLHEYLHAIDLNYRTDLDDVTIDRIANGMAELLQSLGIELEY